MQFTINMEDLLWGALGIIAAIALIYIIITLINLIKVLKNVNALLVENKKNLDTTLDNVAHISENAKDISDVATETTADILVAKENLTGQLDTVKDIVNIIVGVFKK
ncbi:hypothetical protein [uncultured Clostridium sp.]|jgi:uncharacterized protein YoxC|uniref:hypothetical protein n=1 Tax=uncultured Clostridium sp. TaxID=59620 RepID=UPI002621135D|nr:hypothetical protein [uncultured Clostridium sp.]